MEISLEEVKKKFNELINETAPREKIDRWAYMLVQKDELKELKFVPAKDEKKIWEGITYLHGIDLEESPGEYLHSIQNIKDKFDEIFKED